MKQRAENGKTLFVLKRAAMGGSASSLINLLSLYHAQGINFDIFLMDHSGVWTEKMGQYGNLLPEVSALSSAVTDKKTLKTVSQYFYRLRFVLSHKLFGASRAKHKLYRKSVRHLSGKYENVIAYQESETTDFARFIEATNKIAWMHTDFEKFCSLSPQYSAKEIYDCYQHIVCVTDASVKSILARFGRAPETVHLIRNTLPASLIVERAKETVPDVEQKRKPFLFVSVGRLSPEKAYERIPKAARLLVDAGYHFDWYLIGDGASRNSIMNEIERLEVGKNVHMLGSRMNPYSYIQLADCLVITSEYEAQPMVANEALILDTPVVSTAFASVKEVISDGENGMIVSQDEQAIANALSRFMSDLEFRESLSQGAKRFQYSNERELDAVDTLLLRSNQ